MAIYQIERQPDIKPSQSSGSCFNLYFDLIDCSQPPPYIQPGGITTAIVDVHHEMAQDKDPEQTIATASGQHSNITILVVEDHPQLSQHLYHLLSPHYAVVSAADGEAGLMIAREQVPDLIVSDVMMPKMEDYLSKPFDEQELCLKINNLISVRAVWHRYHQRQLEQQPEAVPEGLVAIQLNPIEQAFVEQLNAICHANFGDHLFDIEQIAIQLAMSKRQLQRKTKAITGLTPTEVLKKIRLDAALKAINQGQQPTKVAYSSGFSNYDHFARAFKQAYGCSPKNYK